MMRRTIPILARALTAVALTAPCLAQSIAPIVAYEYGVPLAIERAPGVVNIYGSSGDGSSRNHTLFAGIRLDATLGSSWIASPRIGFAFATGTFVADTFSTASAITLPVTTTREYEVVATTAMLRADLPLRWALSDRLAVLFGPWAGLRLTSGLHQVERIILPADGRYRDSARSRAVAAGEEIGSSTVRGGLLAGAGWGIPLGEISRFEVELYGRLDAGALIDDVGIRALSGGTSVSVLLPFESPRMQPAIASVTPTVRTPLSASISLGNRSAPVRLASSAVHHRLELTLPGEIPYARGETDIPAQFHRLARTEVSAFSDRDLVRLAPAEALRHGFNALGYFLLAHPDRNVTLTGEAAEDERPDAKLERAERIRAYLVEVWGIAPERVHIREETRPGRPRVHVDAGNGYVATEWIERTWSASGIEITKQIEAPAGIRIWSVVLRQGMRELMRFDDREPRAPERFTLSGERPLQPVVAELVVEDSAGSVVVARDTAHLDAAPAVPASREKLTVLFPVNRMTQTDIDALAARVTDRAELEVHIVGDGEDVRLSAALLAEGLLAALRKNAVQVSRVDVRLTGSSPSPTQAVVVEILQDRRAGPRAPDAARGG